MAQPVACRCRSGHRAEVEHHHTASDGQLLKAPGDRDCDLCGGGGTTTSRRLALAGFRHYLITIGAGFSVLACLLALGRLVGQGEARWAFWAASVAGGCFALALGIEVGLARSRPPGPGFGGD